MPSNKFPAFYSASAAAIKGCHNCHEPLDIATLKDARYAPGRGQYSMQCPCCGMSTFFDILKSTKRAA